eukprot:Hpha_TRINITY_DN5014_c0_g1::TRINITY_DN5014_c0_g1_i2::g.93975::m.93975
MRVHSRTSLGVGTVTPSSTFGEGESMERTEGGPHDDGPTPPSGEQWRLRQLRKELDELDNMLMPQQSSVHVRPMLSSVSSRPGAVSPAPEVRRVHSTATVLGSTTTHPGPASPIVASPVPAPDGRVSQTLGGPGGSTQGRGERVSPQRPRRPVEDDHVSPVRMIARSPLRTAAELEVRGSLMERTQQAVALLRHRALVSDGEPGVTAECALAIQGALALLEPATHGGDSRAGVEASLARALAEHDDACKRLLLQQRSPCRGAGVADELRALVVQQELAAVAAEGVRKQQMQKIAELMKEVCAKEGAMRRLEGTLRSRQRQLSEAQDGLASAGARLGELAQRSRESFSLHDTCDALRQQVNDLELALSQRDAQLSAWEPAVQAHDGHIAQIALAEKQRVELGAEAQVARAQAAELQSTIDELDHKLREARTDCARMRSESSSQEGRARQLTRVADEARNAAARLEAEREEAERRCQEESRLRAAREEELLQANRAAEDAHNRAAALGEAESRATALAAASEREMETLSDELASLRRSLHDLQEEGEQAQAESRRLREAKLALQEEADRARGAAAEAAAKGKSSEREVELLRERVQLLEAAAAEQLSTLARREEEALRKMQEGERATRLAVGLQKEREEERAAAEALALERRRQDDALAARERQVAMLEAELVSRRTEAGEAAVAAAVGNSRMAEVQQVLEAESMRGAELRERVLAAELRRDEAEARLREETARADAGSQAIEMVRAQLNDNTQQFGELAAQLQQSQAECAEQAQKTEEAEKRAQVAAEEGKRTEAQVCELAAEVQRLATTVDARTRELQQREAQRTRELQELEEAKLALAELQRHTVAEQEAGRSQAELARRRSAELQEREEQLVELQRECASHSEQLRGALRELSMNRSKAEDSARQAVNLRSAISRLGKKFEECELRATGMMHTQLLDEVLSFMRYTRGWWSMHREDLQPALQQEARDPLAHPYDSPHPVIVNHLVPPPPPPPHVHPGTLSPFGGFRHPGSVLTAASPQNRAESPHRFR